ncbi:MAG: hypothetical protein SRB2_02931 [Desulfobacteraceae bacterium Eth-SRB2]|nr:MAG: hypothetical protein SRB2_02931 [Desulfobacteraceae bacterium Eth-SRB2]
MFILHDILKKLKKEFAHSRKGEERGTWFIYTLIAIIIPFTSSKTSNLFRSLKGLFGFTGIRKKRYYTFMRSPKIPWQRLWQCLWKMIPESARQMIVLILKPLDVINQRQVERSLAAPKSSTMQPSKISQNIHGLKTLSPLGC